MGEVKSVVNASGGAAVGGAAEGGGGGVKVRVGAAPYLGLGAAGLGATWLGAAATGGWGCRGDTARRMPPSFTTVWERFARAAGIGPAASVASAPPMEGRICSGVSPIEPNPTRHSVSGRGPAIARVRVGYYAKYRRALLLRLGRCFQPFHPGRSMPARQSQVRMDSARSASRS